MSPAISSWKASSLRSMARSVIGSSLETTTMLNGVAKPGPITAEILS